MFKKSGESTPGQAPCSRVLGQHNKSFELILFLCFIGDKEHDVGWVEDGGRSGMT